MAQIHILAPTFPLFRLSSQTRLSFSINFFWVRFNLYAATRRLSTIPVHLNQPEDGSSDLDKLRVLRQKIEVSGITLDDSCVPGRYYHLICPKCNGGQLMERSLSFHITQDRNLAMWRCFRGTCGWRQARPFQRVVQHTVKSPIIG